MNRRSFNLMVVALSTLFLFCVSDRTIHAQQRELLTLKREVSKVTQLLRRMKLDEADKVLTDAEKRLEKIIKDHELDTKSRQIVNLNKLIAIRKQLLRTKQIKEEGISYKKHIEPILKKNCIRCHGQNPKGELRLDTLPDLRKGGKNGPVVVANNPNRSLLMSRLVAQGTQRMPKNSDPLSTDDIEVLAYWIQDGKDLKGPIEKKSKVKYAKATGKEKVSFKRDIAPFMVNICFNCHNDALKTSGLSMATFEKLMIGGDSGKVIVPGNLDKSRLWDLAGKQDPIKMPKGRALITRSNHKNLRIWIEEGAKYDGEDPTEPIQNLILTEEQQLEENLKNFSTAEFVKYRKERQEEIWNLVTKKEKPNKAEGKEFLVVGNVSQARVDEIGVWAEEYAETLRKTFNNKDELLFKGKLTIFVLSNRFLYEEFNLSVNEQQAVKEKNGHAIIEEFYEDAYVALQELGEPSETNLGMKANLIRLITDAYFKRQFEPLLPQWLSQGTATMMAVRDDPKNPHFVTLKKRVAKRLESVTKPESIFSDETFSPIEAGEVGSLLVEFLGLNGGMSKYRRLLDALAKNANQGRAFRDIYKSDQKKIGQSFLNSMRQQSTGKRRRR